VDLRTKQWKETLPPYGNWQLTEQERRKVEWPWMDTKIAFVSGIIFCRAALSGSGAVSSGRFQLRERSRFQQYGICAQTMGVWKSFGATCI